MGGVGVLRSDFFTLPGIGTLPPHLSKIRGGMTRVAIFSLYSFPTISPLLASVRCSGPVLYSPPSLSRDTLLLPKNPPP